MNNIDVSIQIVNYNSGQRIIETLDALVDSISDGLSYEIIIVDNASSDNSLAMIKEKYPDIHLIENRENRFFSGAHNQACKVAKGKYILILNSDITFTAGVLEKLYRYLEENSAVGGVSPGLFKSDNPNEMGCLTWDEVSLVKLILTKYPQYWLLVKLRLIRTTQAKKINATREYDAKVVSDACLIVRRDLFNKIGGYDEKMLLYCTEDDLCMRIIKSGFKIMILPYLKVYHDHGHSTKQVSKLFLNRIIWNDYVYFWKKTRGSIDAGIVNFFCAIGHFSLFVKEKIKKVR